MAGDEQSLKVTFRAAVMNPPKYMVVPPFGIVNMLLLKDCSVFQFTPMVGSPAFLPIRGDSNEITGRSGRAGVGVGVAVCWGRVGVVWRPTFKRNDVNKVRCLGRSVRREVRQNLCPQKQRV